MIIFGVIGYLNKKTDYEGAPLVLALVLGDMFENSLRQSLMLSNGSFLVFVARPIAASFFFTAMALLIFPLIPHLRKRRPAVGIEEA
jgi:putative tricarboxylic transport membrane protein